MFANFRNAILSILRKAEADTDERQASEPDDRRVAFRFGLDGRETLIRFKNNVSTMQVKDISCSGLGGITELAVPVGATIFIALSSQELRAAHVKWVRNMSMGLKFVRPLDLDAVLCAREWIGTEPLLPAQDRAGEDDARDTGGALAPGTRIPLVHPTAAQHGLTGSGSMTAPIDYEASGDSEAPWHQGRSLESNGLPVHASHGEEEDGQEQRANGRTITLYRTGFLETENESGLCRLRNISDTGMMVTTSIEVAPGELLQLTLSNNIILSGRVVWTNPARVGVQFDESINAAHLLKALVRERHSGAYRPPRLPVTALGTAMTDKGVYPVRVRNISQHGVQVTHDHCLETGAMIKIALENGLELRGAVRWTNGTLAGLKLSEALPLERLAVMSEISSSVPMRPMSASL